MTNYHPRVTFQSSFEVGASLEDTQATSCKIYYIFSAGFVLDFGHCWG